MEPSAKRKIKLAFGVLGILVLCRLAIPVPLRGDWCGFFTEHMCDEHAFVRYADGNVTFYHDHSPPKRDGTYVRVGWSTFRWVGPSNFNKPITAYPGWFFVRYEGVGTNGT